MCAADVSLRDYDLANIENVRRLYTKGVTPKLKNLYARVGYPVSRETRMLAPLVRWQHDRDWMVAFSSNDDLFPGERRITVQTKSKEFSYMFDHVIDGRHILPGFCYVVSA